MRLDDKFSDPMRKIQRQVERNQKAMVKLGNANEQAAKSAQRVSSAQRLIGSGLSGIGSATKSIFSLQNAFIGLAGAIGGAAAAKKIFDATIGEAAKFEQSSVMIGAMFDDKKLSKQYIEMVNGFAIDSPIMDSQTMMANSKSFITASKDVKDLEKMWSLTERLAATDPMQGLDGAVFALRELFSGDAISLQRRFEMGGAEIDKIKKMDLPDQLRELDKYFNKIGLSQKLIDEMGGTTLGLWQQIKESVAVALRDMGAPALQHIRKFLKGIVDSKHSVEELNKMRSKMDPTEFARRMERAMRVENFKKTGARILENIASGMISGITKITDWFSKIQSDPNFQKQTTLFGKVDFVMSDIYQRFLSWYSDGGSSKIERIAKDVTEFLANSLDANATRFADVGLKIGGKILEGIYAGIGKNIYGQIDVEKELPKYDPSKYLLDPDQFIPPNIKMGEKPKKGPSHASGLSRVPYNGYQATLHKDERVLTPEENSEYNRGSGRGNVTITGNTFNVRQDSDIKKIALELAKLIEREGVRMA